MILLTVLCTVLFILTGFLSFVLYRQNKKLQEYFEALKEGQKVIELALNYEEFYSSTVEEISEVVDTIETLLSRRQMLSNDPDVQNLVKILAIAHDTLLRYINVKNSTSNPRSDPVPNK